VDAPVTRPVSQQQLYVTVALHFGVKVSDAPQGAWAQAGAAAWPAGTCAHASRVFSEVIGALWPWLATAPDPSPGASQQQLYAIVALQRGLDVSCGVHCSIPPGQAVGGGAVPAQQQLYVMVALHCGVKVFPAAHCGIPAGQAAAAAADVHRLLSWLVAVPAQQQLPVTVALHRGVNVSAGVQVAAWTEAAAQLQAAGWPWLDWPAVPQVAALPAVELHVAEIGPLIMHGESPDLTMRHLPGLSYWSLGSCTSSSACPSQQSSKPSASNSWSPTVSWAASNCRWPQELPGVFSAPSTPMKEPRP
jgi:hypothetical protein